MRSPDDIVSVLYGCEAAYKNVVGYCKYHHRFLTVKQLKRKQCLGKQCKLLSKRDNKFWEERENRKLLKQSKKI